MREPGLYGSGTYEELKKHIRADAKRLGVEVEILQTNHEGVLVSWIQCAKGVYDAIVLNAAAYTHTSVAILDALKAVQVRTIEVHLTDPKMRESFRHVSYVEPAAEKTFAGLGFGSYTAALEYLVR